jgi:FkbM family methyltransferase
MSQAVSPDGRVHAFEPVPSAREQLKKAAIASDPNGDVIVIYPYALSDRQGVSEFIVAIDLPEYSGLKTRIYDAPTRIERIEVELRSLDSLFENAIRLDYVKIDAEGGELGILSGAATILDLLNPVVTFEFGANSIGGYSISVEDMDSYWRCRPYALYDILGRLLNSEQFVKSAVKQEVWDYLALPRERAAEIINAWRSVGKRPV